MMNQKNLNHNEMAGDSVSMIIVDASGPCVEQENAFPSLTFSVFVPSVYNHILWHLDSKAAS